MPVKLARGPLSFTVIALLLLVQLAPTLTYAQQVSEGSELDTTIMLEKARPAIAMVVSIAYAVAFWSFSLPDLEDVGIVPPLQVQSASFGSGFFVSPNGYLITNGHVVNDFESEFVEHLPLIKYIAILYAKKYAEKYGTYPSMDKIYQIFQIMVQAYLNNMLKLQDYNVLVYVCLGKVVTGIGNIEKCQVARVVESRPFEREDLALLKIEVKHAPSLIVAAEEAHIGERVWVLGYPGAVTFHDLLSQTTTMIPTITSGVISGYREKITGLSVLQSDVAVTHGNSGGPMLNSRGEVIAVTSFGSADPTDSGREVPGFNFFIPSKYVVEMMKRNGVDNTQDPVMQLYEEGLRLYFNKHYSAAIEKFQMVKDLSPGFPYVDEYIAEARAAILRGEDVPLEQGMGLGGVAVPLAALAGLGITIGFIVIRRRTTTRLTAKEEPYPYPQSTAPPAYPVKQVSSSEALEAEPPPAIGVASTQVEPPPRIKYCWNCGRPIPIDSSVCPYCKADQEVE